MDRIKKVVDAALDQMSKKKSMMVPGEIPLEMLDNTVQAMDDWKAWRPIDSIITDKDIERFEATIKLKLPLSYKAYLKYKHFFELQLQDIAVNLFKHLPDKNLSELNKHIFNYHEPEELIGRKYIYIADFHDYGLLCFDANKPASNNEYTVVYIDHENLDDIFVYANSFCELLEADSDKGNNFINLLNERYK